jgi:hypothetical protein
MERNYDMKMRSGAWGIAICFAALAIGVVGLLALPARAVTVFAPKSSVRIMGAFAPASPRSGESAKLTVTITGRSGRRELGAKLSADVSMMTMDMGITHPAFTAVGDGRYSARVNFSMAGPWAVTVHVKTLGGAVATRIIKVNVGG